MSDDKTGFTTGKPHVSFSEVRIWTECPWKHKLMYIDKVLEFEVGIYTEYGSILHETVENYLNTGNMDIDNAIKMLEESWKTNGFDEEENVKSQVLLAESQGWKYKHDYFDKWKGFCETSLGD